MVVETVATAAHDWHHFVIVEYANALFDLERLDLVVNVLTTENSVSPQSLTTTNGCRHVLQPTVTVGLTIPTVSSGWFDALESRTISRSLLMEDRTPPGKMLALMRFGPALISIDRCTATYV